MQENNISRTGFEGSETDLPREFDETEEVIDSVPVATATQAQGERTTDNPNEIVRDGGEHVITDDLDALLQALPPTIVSPLRELNNRVNLLEVVMDLGRKPEARYRGSEHLLTDLDITEAEINYVIERIGQFGGDNR